MAGRLARRNPVSGTVAGHPLAERVAGRSQHLPVRCGPAPRVFSDAHGAVQSDHRCVSSRMDRFLILLAFYL